MRPITTLCVVLALLAVSMTFVAEARPPKGHMKPEHQQPQPHQQQQHQPKPHQHQPKPHHHHHQPQGNETMEWTTNEQGQVSCTFNGFSGTCQDVSGCSGTSIKNKCPGANNIQCCITQGSFSPGCGKAAVQRGQEWVNMQIQYCQSANGQPDGDPDCSSVCQRSINHKWDAYRSDCSGFISYAYGLPAPGRSTGEFAPFETDITYNIKIDELTAGDPINSVPHEHIMMFVRWTNSAHTQMELLEEPGCSANPPYARVTVSDVTVENGLLRVAANGMLFQPIRFRSNNPTC